MWLISWISIGLVVIFPAFNVADSGITMGAVLLILDMFITDQDTQR